MKKHSKTGSMQETDIIYNNMLPSSLGWGVREIWKYAELWCISPMINIRYAGLLMQ